MRQLIAFINASNKRKSMRFYQEMCLHAGVNGAKIAKSFGEMFPEYTDEKPIDVTPESAKLMEDLESIQLKRAEEAYARAKRTAHKN